MYTKINKTKARKLVAQCKQVFCAPNNAWLGSAWISPCEVPFDRDFDKFCNEYVFYNCGTELGKRIAFYVKEVM